MTGVTDMAHAPVHPGLPAPRRSLRTSDVMALVVGVVIGAGIFSVPSVVAANSGGAGALVLAWLVGGALSLAGALCTPNWQPPTPTPAANTIS
ncbi:MAG: hypothetical protein H0W24_04595 [Lysobacter sp.]|nr:hypothetical protein [Lysobacter sp.]